MAHGAHKLTKYEWTSAVLKRTRWDVVRSSIVSGPCGAMVSIACTHKPEICISVGDIIRFYIE